MDKGKEAQWGKQTIWLGVLGPAWEGEEKTKLSSSCKPCIPEKNSPRELAWGMLIFLIFFFYYH